MACVLNEVREARNSIKMSRQAVQIYLQRTELTFWDGQNAHRATGRSCEAAESLRRRRPVACVLNEEREAQNSIKITRRSIHE